MRNPLKRLARRPDLPNVPLRERLASAKAGLAAAKEKYARTLRVHRALIGPLPAPPPAVDRVALTNYATFLAWERSRPCAELYPHMGRRAFAFVAGLNAADRFFYGSDGRRRSIAPPASTRALKVLDVVGIDWREDGDEARLDRLHGSRFRDNGERPAVPHNWPAPDAALLEALDDLQRLDAALKAMSRTGDPPRDADDAPGYVELEEARGHALGRLAEERAETLTGLQVKARALLTPSVEELPEEQFAVIAASLARNLLEAPPAAVELQPDPIFAVIEESRRLYGVWTAAMDLPPHNDPHPDQLDAQAAFNEHVADVLLKTVPTTARGCQALARYATEVSDVDDFTLDEDDGNHENWRLLTLIARSPLL